MKSTLLLAAAHMPWWPLVPLGAWGPVLRGRHARQRDVVAYTGVSSSNAPAGCSHIQRRMFASWCRGTIGTESSSRLEQQGGASTPHLGLVTSSLMLRKVTKSELMVMPPWSAFVMRS